jgi:hypothetical protein
MLAAGKAEAAVRYPWHLIMVALLSLAWNGMGALDYVMTQTRNEGWMARFSPAQLEYFYGFPSWAVACWALGVWGAVAGSVLLLLRSALALWAFVLSLLGIAGTSLWQFALSPVPFFQIAGAVEAAFSAVIVAVTILLIAYARAMKRRGLLR